MHFSMKKMAVVAALLTAAAAAPASTTLSNEMSSPIVTRDGPIVLPGKTDQDAPPPQRRDLIVRGATDTYGDYTGSNSSYPDGSGTYLRSDDTHTYASGDKCWTDFFHISQSYKDTDWKRKATVDCSTSTGSMCNSGLDDGVQTCTEWSIAVSAGASWSILKDVVSVEGSVTYTHGQSSCETVTTKSTCQWSDGQCHSIWYSQKIKVSHGYIRRRCDLHDGKGDRTVWSKDWDLDQKADELSLGCKADCKATSYPG
jgi:hypothetical protein